MKNATLSLSAATLTLFASVAGCKTSNPASDVASAEIEPGTAGDICAPVTPVGGEGAADVANRFYADNELHTVHIDMAPADWDTMRHQAPPKLRQPVPGFSCSKFKAKFTVDVYQAGDVTLSKKSICGSVSSSKPGLKVHKVKTDGKDYFFPEGSEPIADTLLNNSIQDPSYQRQCFSYKLIRDQGYPAMRCNYVALCVNNQF